MTVQDHIVKSFDREINDLNDRIEEMGRTCRAQLNLAVKSLQEMDADLARRVVNRDADLNLLYSRLEEAAVEMIAKRQPLAVDLRYLLSVMRTGVELERIGDYAANMAKRVLEMTSNQFAPVTKQIPQMVKVCNRMLDDVITAFVALDSRTAAAVWHQDDHIDHDFALMMNALNHQMRERSEDIHNCTQLIFIGRCLERIGDHITNIAEDIYYIHTGENFIEELNGNTFQ